jgi:ferredoxin
LIKALKINGWLKLRIIKWGNEESLDTVLAEGSNTRTCVEICPEVFELEGELATTKQGADLSLDKKIIEAAEACPVEAIHYEQ